jgi:aminopeptidase N
LRYFNDYFGVKYPLPKLDLIAVPSGFGGAMENWGGITSSENGLLFDPAANPTWTRRGIFGLLAHEMAHQWFGNLVTMGWWDNIWLNEGFASWMQAKATERFYPQWQTWLNGSGAKQFAMDLDARRSAHPIQQPVANETEAMTLFDGITYAKGQALIRMLEAYLGERAFRDGIRRYMAAHAYGNTTTADLWQALEAAAGKPVANIASTFTEQAGVPLIIAQAVCSGDEQRMVLRQEPFNVGIPAPDSGASAGANGKAPPRWQIPVTAGPPRATHPSATVLLDGQTEIAAGQCGETIKLNLGDIGYYRVEYDAATRAALVKTIALLAPVDRVNLIADSWALVKAGRSEPQTYLELIDELGNDESRAVWERVTGTLTGLVWLTRGRPERPALQAYARAKLHPLFDRLGWDPAGPEAGDGPLLRPNVIRVLGELGDEEILAEARRRFAAFLDNSQSLRPGLRDTVIHLVGLTADRVTYDALIALARKSTITHERDRYYAAAASARDPELARETLALTLTDELPNTVIGGMIGAVASAGEQPALAWDFVSANFEALASKQSPYFRNTFVSSLMTNFSDAERAAELAAFAPVHATSGGRIIATRAEETILIAAAFKARALPAIADWLKKRNGLD